MRHWEFRNIAHLPQRVKQTHRATPKTPLPACVRWRSCAGLDTTRGEREAPQAKAIEDKDAKPSLIICSMFAGLKQFYLSVNFTPEKTLANQDVLAGIEFLACGSSNAKAGASCGLPATPILRFVYLPLVNTSNSLTLLPLAKTIR